MKSKILFQLFLLSALGVIYLTMESNSAGKFNNGNTCGNCHGSLNAATSVIISGLPSLFVTGQTYPLSVIITNATNTKAGFNVSANGGTFIAGVGSKINVAATQITHTTPMNAVNNVTTFSFSWTAPNTTSQVTFNVAGNAVNGDNGDSGADQWNTSSESINGTFPTSVNELSKEFLKTYPNPATEKVIIEGVHADNIFVYNINGEKLNVNFHNYGDKCILDC